MGMENNDLFREQNKRLRRIQDSTSLAVGTSGFKRYGASTVTGVRHEALVVQEDTVFTAFFVDGVNVLSARGMGGVTFKQGAFLPGGQDITGWTISVGSVIAY
jgi:hypothetical protein